MDNSSSQATLAEYRSCITSKAVDDVRNREWFTIEPVKIYGDEKLSITNLINAFIDERYNWHMQIDKQNFGKSDKVYTQRYIENIGQGLNQYIPDVVNYYGLTSIIRSASIMPEDYVQKMTKVDQVKYRVYVEFIMDIKASTADFEGQEIYKDGSNSMSFWIFMTNKEGRLRIDGWYEMIQTMETYTIVPYWSKSDAKTDAV
jgi:hypothetical protein